MPVSVHSLWRSPCIAAGLPGEVNLMKRIANFFARWIFSRSAATAPSPGQKAAGTVPEGWNTEPFWLTGTVAKVSACLEAGADPKARDSDGKAPWDYGKDNGTHLPFGDCMTRCFKPSNPGMILRLIGKFSTRYSSRSASRWNTPAFWKTATLTKVSNCLKAGADPRARDKNGLTPLHSAAALTHNPAVITALLRAGADPNVKDNMHQTPLHDAAIFNMNPDVITALLKAGADPKIRNKDQKTPWDCVQDNGVLKNTEAFWRLR